MRRTILILSIIIGTMWIGPGPVEAQNPEWNLLEEINGVKIAFCFYLNFLEISNFLIFIQTGGTFTVRWLRIFDLPFDQTNHICNPWNGNRPVKFSRDGQPVPVDVGQQIQHLFDVAVQQFGSGSAILRNPIQLSQSDIAIQKLFVNGKFIPAMDMHS